MEMSCVESSYAIELRTLSGETILLPSMQSTDTVFDLSRSVRSSLQIPISVQKLIWVETALNVPSQQLGSIFGECLNPDVNVVRRPFTPEERAELHKRLVRATCAARVAEVRELLKEGAPVNLESTKDCRDVSMSLNRWEEDLEDAGTDSAAAKQQPRNSTQATCARGGKQNNGDVESEEGDEDIDMEDEGEEPDEEAEEGITTAPAPCGGISPLLAALVTGQDDLAQDFRELGAWQVDMEPQLAGGIKEAFSRKDFKDAALHMARGTNLNVRLARGRQVPGALDEWGIWPGSDLNFGTPLHACAAMHKIPGSYEVAQLLIHLGADLNARDTEGDSPLAHARFFRAREIYKLYKGKGAILAGPFYRRFEDED